MYRKVLLLLYLGMASSAPHDELEYTASEEDTTIKGSSTENLPITILEDGRTINEDLTPEESSDDKKKEYSYEDTKTTVPEDDVDTANDDITRTTLSQDFDTSFKSNFKPDFDNYKSSVQPELDIFKSTIEVNSTINTEIPETTVKPDVATPKIVTKPSFTRFKSTAKPRFHSKLSYFQKKDSSGVASNLIESRNSRRKFRSNCRCAKISNCPKLQISVPRCPEEQFMCCF